ncbi:23S rRNA (guanosine(2251)-2'-O)-methyltransferase RlmB [Fluviicola sp.]|jgi:23S rRNA (guanosine2251-2'-O)-methyltransferase|uniref:23S rRNA (guanosine(2251)-2'-O)-methyltransferase RlmB n=1 Tax=Fluviicola sp. TaxID=1917219 RepID=UPI002816E11F|nr:23S rRNA (guanosine(2251)-2'-O)-methyltransferase RlmB [Fluviicola sp.]MDR0801668.1 23S rRNA (guanosine(2251)-2'-O)-methyltransferase RlmB [Fluviicola sp.]
MYNKKNEHDERGGGFNRDKRSFDRKPKEDSSDIIYGIRVVIEAIKNEIEINKILIQKGIDKDLFEELRTALTGKDYQLQYVPVEKLNKLTSNNHQGVVAFTSPVEYQNIEDLCDQWLSEGKEPCILVLDRITDVRNFGGIARTAACMGVNAILVPSKGSALVSADAIKTSAGALHTIPVCKTDLLKDSLFYLQQSGFQIVSCTEKSKISVENYAFFGPTAIVMGSEENGISNDLLKMSDARLSIPMAGEIASLNVGVATGMILYERLKQMKATK